MNLNLNAKNVRRCFTPKKIWMNTAKLSMKISSRMNANTAMKLFGYLSDKKEHFATVHKANISFPCKICHETFRCSSYYKEHIDYIHNKLPNTFPCPFCDSMYRSAPEVRKHIAYVHEGIRDCLCSICGKAFSKPSGLKKHTMTIHEGKKP